MALILGSRDGDIESSRSIQELFSALDSIIQEQAAHLMPAQHQSLLDGIARHLREETAWEEKTLLQAENYLGDLAEAPDKTTLEKKLNSSCRLAQDHFIRRESVAAAHSFCTSYRDVVVKWGVSSLIKSLGQPPAPFALGALADWARGESTLKSSCKVLIVCSSHADYFSEFARKLGNFLSYLKLNDPVSDLPETAVSCSTLDDWIRLIEIYFDSPGPLSLLVALKDLRLVSGDPDLLNELQAAAFRNLASHPVRLLTALRGAATMPAGFNFFGKLKVEKSGSHRGEFNLQHLAISPLVAIIRMLAIRSNISAPSTPERIKLLVDAGELGVDLAAKIMKGYHNFLRLKIFTEISGKVSDQEGFFIGAEDMVEDEEETLIQGLDALANLQRILYQSVEA